MVIETRLYFVRVVTDKREFIQCEEAIDPKNAEKQVLAWIFDHEKIESIQVETKLYDFT